MLITTCDLFRRKGPRSKLQGRTYALPEIKHTLCSGAAALVLLLHTNFESPQLLSNFPESDAFET